MSSHGLDIGTDASGLVGSECRLIFSKRTLMDTWAPPRTSIQGLLSYIGFYLIIIMRASLDSAGGMLMPFQKWVGFEGFPNEGCMERARIILVFKVVGFKTRWSYGCRPKMWRYRSFAAWAMRSRNFSGCTVPDVHVFEIRYLSSSSRGGN